MMSSSLRAIIIAGGLGTRLASASNNLPKSLMPIGNQPLLKHQLDLLLCYGVTDISISTGYKSDEIEQYIHSVSEYKKHVRVICDKWTAGSGGCLQFLPDYENKSIVFLGDVAIKMDLERFILFHEAHKGIASLVLQKNNHPLDCDVVALDQNNVCTHIYCKPHSTVQNLSGYMIAGVFILEPQLIKLASNKQKMDLVHDLIAPAIHNNMKVIGYYTEEYLSDIGTPQKYLKSNEEWTKQ